MICGSSSGWLMLAGMTARPRATSRTHEFRFAVLADRDELHLFRDDALARVVHLRHVRAGLRAARRALRLEADRVELAHRLAGDAVDRRRLRQLDGVVAPFDPTLAQRRDARPHVDRDVGIGERPAGIVDGVHLAVRQRDRAERDPDRSDRIPARTPCATRGRVRAKWPRSAGRYPLVNSLLFLRRYYPDQVRKHHDWCPNGRRGRPSPSQPFRAPVTYQDATRIARPCQAGRRSVYRIALRPSPIPSGKRTGFAGSWNSEVFERVVTRRIVIATLRPSPRSSSSCSNVHCR